MQFWVSNGGQQTSSPLFCLWSLRIAYTFKTTEFTIQEGLETQRLEFSQMISMLALQDTQ